MTRKSALAGAFKSRYREQKFRMGDGGAAGTGPGGFKGLLASARLKKGST
ncbi:MAG: hypothetical protein QUV08_04800 [Parasphingorhabdus sp.]|nr:hypothetical protein [Parasphingorhabdus sp.]